MADKLKECPFCGGEAKSWHNNTGGITVGCVSNRCRIAPTISTFDRDIRNAENEAIEAWNERNNWHTGTPTEEGWYLQRIKSKNMISYDTDYYENGDWKYSCALREIIAWQKIEPYKEEKNNG